MIGLDMEKRELYTDVRDGYRFKVPPLPTIEDTDAYAKRLGDRWLSRATSYEVSQYPPFKYNRQILDVFLEVWQIDLRRQKNYFYIDHMQDIWAPQKEEGEEYREFDLKDFVWNPEPKIIGRTSVGVEVSHDFTRIKLLDSVDCECSRTLEGYEPILAGHNLTSFGNKMIFLGALAYNHSVATESSE